MPELFDRRCFVSIKEGETLLKQVEGYREDLEPAGLRVRFQVVKALDAIADSATVRIYNLEPSTRKTLAQRNILFAGGSNRVLQISAGYMDDVGAIFNGVITRVLNQYAAPDWITTIEAAAYLDALLNSRIDVSYGSKGGVPVKQVLEGALSDVGLKGIKYGAKAAEVLSSKVTSEQMLSGNLMEMVRKMLAGTEMFLYVGTEGPAVVEYGEPSDTTRPIVISEDPSSEHAGLLGAPRVDDLGAQIRSLLDHRIHPGRLVSVHSRTLEASTPGLGNVFTAWGVQHSGDTHGNDWYTDIQGLFYPLPVKVNTELFGASPISPLSSP